MFSSFFFGVSSSCSFLLPSWLRWSRMKNIKRSCQGGSLFGSRIWARCFLLCAYESHFKADWRVTYPEEWTHILSSTLSSMVLPFPVRTTTPFRCFFFDFSYFCFFFTLCFYVHLFLYKISFPPLAVLLSNLPRPELRINLLKNKGVRELLDRERRNRKAPVIIGTKRGKQKRGDRAVHGRWTSCCD